jgi:hypothetical protein
MTAYSQPGIINALDYGLIPNDTTVAYANTTALIAAIAAAQASCDQSGSPKYGGTVIIPSNDAVPPSTNGDGGVYYFATRSLGAAITITCPYPILLLGTGNGTKLVMTQNNDLFEVNNNVDSGETGASGGVTFQDLEIDYSEGATSGAAIRVTGNSQNVRLFRVTLNDCPVGVALDQSLKCSIIDCVIWYQQNTGTAVTLGTTESGIWAKETYIAGCLFEAGNVGTGTGLSILHADELRVTNTRIESFVQGIVIAPAIGFAEHLFFENVSVFTLNPNISTTVGAALLIQPTGAGYVLQAVFVGCQLSPTQTTTNYTGPGVLIDQSQTSGGVDQVRFVSCWSCIWQGHGLQINGAVTSVEILGGYYSCNGQSSSGTYSGILITSASSGSPSGVRIVGAACNNSVYTDYGALPDEGEQMPAKQGYGISIAAGPTYIKVHACDLTGNVTQALSATTPDITVHVTDCAGYNDKGTPLAITHPTKNQIFYAQSSPYYYCGPVAFYASGGGAVSITVDGNPTGLPSGGFTLSPGEFAKLDWTTAPGFLMVGK